MTLKADGREDSEIGWALLEVNGSKERLIAYPLSRSDAKRIAAIYNFNKALMARLERCETKILACANTLDAYETGRAGMMRDELVAELRRALSMDQGEG